MSVTFDVSNPDTSSDWSALQLENMDSIELANEVSRPETLALSRLIIPEKATRKVKAWTVPSIRILRTFFPWSYQGGEPHFQFDSWPTAAPFVGLMMRQPASSMIHSHVPQIPEVPFEVSAGLTSAFASSRLMPTCWKVVELSASAYARLGADCRHVSRRLATNSIASRCHFDDVAQSVSVLLFIVPPIQRSVVS